ncbi:MAG: nickel pincer cofactor biosynthesis protein LarB [Nitrospirae bacterium]|nr:nickel pincer cofactor biosynthesis protein LarB [Nitrospirota bacterium]
MDRDAIRKLLSHVRKGTLSVDAAMMRLRHMPYEPLGFAAIDHHRELRQGHPEVIFCEGKRPEQVLAIIRRMKASGRPVLATRATPQLFRAVKRIDRRAAYHDSARAITIQDKIRPDPSRRPKPAGGVLILTAGTSDIPVAEEAKVTLEFLGNRVETVYDVGVAGLHRLLDHRSRIEAARVLIVAAGMDGALPSVIGGWVDKPIVAVPTRIGYGASFGGIAALLTMLNSCAAGVAVVNIDNGFGAAVLAHRILRTKI